MHDLVIRGGTIAGGAASDIAIDEGVDHRHRPRSCPAAREEIDAAGLTVFPGLIDAHLHFNEPGRTEWEGARHGQPRARCRRRHAVSSTCR